MEEWKLNCEKGTSVENIIKKLWIQIKIAWKASEKDNVQRKKEYFEISTKNIIKTYTKYSLGTWMEV